MPARQRNTQYSYILFYKPHGVLCQFSDREGRNTLAAFGPFPRTVYPVGRLDADSEGLVLLTDDGHLKHLLLEPSYAHERTYLAQVERIPTPDALSSLRRGIVLDGRITREADVQLLEDEPTLPPRREPIRFRKNVPTSWLRITLKEGRNRQVRRMTAAVGHPTLRLVRVKFGVLTLSGLSPGEHRELSGEEVALLLASVSRPPE